jgi:GNAT superfamily N-acetyltransferase
MCGADWIDAAGDPYLEKYPLITALWTMQCPRNALRETDARLVAVTEESVQRWLDIYNERMADIPNAAYMDGRDGRELLKSGDGYFVYRDDRLLGIGKAKDDFIDAVISVQPGAGETVLLALCSALFSENVVLEVASDNERAIRLYERMGFLKTELLRTWYDVTK